MSGGSAANTMCGHRQLRRTGGATSARWPTIRSVTCSATTCGPSASPSHERQIGCSACRTGRCLIVVTPDAPAHDEHLPRRVVAARSRRRRRRSRHVAGRCCTWRATSGIDRRPRRPTARRPRLAHAAGAKVSLTLSDSFCVDRHRDDFFQLVEDEVDILFANEDELDGAVSGRRLRRRAAGRPRSTARSPPSRSASAVRSSSPTVTSSRSTPNRSTTSSTPPVPAICTPPASSTASRTTIPWPSAAGLGSLAAAEVISHVGARPLVSLRRLAGLG